MKLTDTENIEITFEPGVGAAPDMFSLRATGVVTNTDGTPFTCHDGQPLVVRRHHSCPKTALLKGDFDLAAFKADLQKQLLESADGALAEVAAYKAWRQLR